MNGMIWLSEWVNDVDWQDAWIVDRDKLIACTIDIFNMLSSYDKYKYMIIYDNLFHDQFNCLNALIF